MTIEKGAAWGKVTMTPFDLVVAPDEAAMARVVANGALHVALHEGDVLRALGATAKLPMPGEPSLQLPCDLLQVRLDDTEPVAVVNNVLIGTVLRPRAWISAGGFIGRLNVAPRAHPNDGLVDALEFDATLSPRHILAIRRRMKFGDHLPHPALRVHRDTTYTWTSNNKNETARQLRAPVMMDGRRFGRARTVHVTVQPDAYVLCVAMHNAG